MASYGVGPNGGVSMGSSESNEVIFLLKSSTGETLKTYKVPKDQADGFEASMEQERQNLSQSLNKGELHLVRLTKCF